MDRKSIGRRGEQGSSLIEFALVSLVLLAVLLGIVDMGRALFAYDFISQAAPKASRFAMVRGSSCSGLSGGCPASSSDIQTYVRGMAPGLKTTAITATAICLSGSSGTPPCDPGSSVRVTVQYSFAFLSPFTPRTWTMRRSSQVTVAQ